MPTYAGEGPDANKKDFDFSTLMSLFGPTFSPTAGMNPLYAAIRAAHGAESGQGLAQAERLWGHQNAHGPRPPHKGNGLGGMGGAMGDYAYGKEQWRADQQRKKDLEYQRQQLEMQNYFNNKQIGDKMNLIQQFFGRNPNGYHSTSTEHTQELVNNAGRHEPRTITTHTATDMSMQLLQQFLGG